METESIFTMADVHKVIKMPLADAKRYAMDVIMQNSTAKDKTKAKAKMMVNKCTTPDKLAFAMSSWILAHPSEGLKVVQVVAAGTM